MPNARPEAKTDLHTQISHGLFWTALQHWGIHAIKFLVLLVLARWISPALFGTYALGAAVIAFAQLFSGQGMASALLQRHRLEDGHKGAAFLSMLAWSFGLAGVLTGAASTLAHLLAGGESASRIALLIRLLAWTLPLNAVSGTGIALLRRELGYSRVAVTTTCSQLGGSAVAVMAALHGAGLWSLVTRQLAETAILAFLCLRAAPWSCIAQSSWSRYREMTRVAAPVAGANLMAFARGRLDELLIGYWLGAEALGLYAMARRQIDAVSALVPAVIGNAFSPILSHVQKDQLGLRAARERGIRLLGALVLPVFATVAATASDWLPFLVGQRWSSSVPILHAFAIAGAFISLLQFNQSILLATGHPRIRFVLEAIVTATVLLAEVAALPWGPRSMAYASAAAVAIVVPLGLLWAARQPELAMGKQILILWPSLLHTLAMTAVLIGLRMVLPLRCSASLRIGVLAAVALLLIGVEICRSGSLRGRRRTPAIIDAVS